MKIQDIFGFREPAHTIPTKTSLAEQEIRTVTRRSLSEAKPKSSLADWFGNSRVVDTAGHPLVVFHGTNQTFDRFAKKRGGIATGKLAGARHGFFFTSDHEEAQDYAKHAASKVVPNVTKFEKETAQLRQKAERLERIASRTGQPADWNAYEQAQSAWEDYEIGATREEDNANTSVISAYLSLQNPLEVNFNGTLYSEHGSIEDVVSKAVRDGNDGVIMSNINDGPYRQFLSTHYVAFSSKQIRRV